MSRGYNEYCGKENRIEKEKCPIIIKCGCPNSSQIITTDEEFILFGKEIAKDKKYNVGVHRITIWKEDALEYEKMNLLT